MLAIKSLPLLSDLHPDELAVIAEHTRLCTFRRGETVVSAAEMPIMSMHLILEGRVVERRGDRPFRTHGPQRVVGGIDALAHAASDIVVIADEDTRTLAIDRDDLRDVLEDNFGVLSVALQGVAMAALRMRVGLIPSAGFAAGPTGSSGATGRSGRSGNDDRAAHDELGARIAFLARRTWLGHARMRTLGQLARDAEPVSLADGDRLWAEGEAAEHGAVIVAGRVACTTADGRHRFEVGQGTVIGLEEALSLESRWYTASAREAVAGLRISRAGLLDVLEDDSGTALAVLAAFAEVASALRDAAARGDRGDA
jgi:CRP-like cAMP-binding protein